MFRLPYHIILTGTIFLTGCSQLEPLIVNEFNDTAIIETENDFTSESIGLTYAESVNVDFLSEMSDTYKASYTQDSQVYITESGTYYFSGEFTTHNIVVNVDKDLDEGTVYLVLDQVSISSTTTTPIYIMEAKDVVFVLEGENRIYQSYIESTEEEFPNSAIYSMADTVITGGGSLEVISEYMRGINSRDDLIIHNATINVTSVEDGIVGKDLLAFVDATITVVTGQDGLCSDELVQIDGGVYDIYSGNGFVSVLNDITIGEGSGNAIKVTDTLETSMKGIKSSNILIQQGEIYISSYEDGIHADNELLINNGTITIETGDDALHADVSLTINGGNIIVTNGYEGIESDSIYINSGTIWVSVLDDAINNGSENGCITISGGDIYITSQGDGIDSNGDLIIEGGNIVIENYAIHTGGDGPLDISGTMSISGGTIVDGEGNTIDTTQQLQGGGMFQNQRPNMNSSMQGHMR